MMLTNNNLRNENINDILRTIEKKDFKLILNEYFIFEGILQNNDFMLNNYNEEDDIAKLLKEKLNNYYKLSLNYSYENSNIYELKIIQITLNEIDKVFYIKYKKIEKNQKIFYFIKNKNLEIITKKFKKDLNKVINFMNNDKKNLITNKFSFKKNYNINYLLKIINKLKKISKLNIKLLYLTELNKNLRKKLDKEQNITYKFFLKSLKFKNKIKQKQLVKNELVSKLENLKKKKQLKKDKLNLNNNELLKDNFKICKSINIEYCNYQINFLNIFEN